MRSINGIMTIGFPRPPYTRAMIGDYIRVGRVYGHVCGIGFVGNILEISIRVKDIFNG